MKWASVFNSKRFPKIWAGGMGVIFLLMALLASLAHFGGVQVLVPGAAESAMWAALAALLAIYVPEVPEKYWYPTVYGILAAPFLTLVLAAGALLVGLRPSGWLVLLAWLGTFWLMKRVSLAGTLKVTIPCAVGIWFFGILFASLTWDFSYEGESFQKPAATLIAKGWNPIYAPDPAVFLQERGLNVRCLAGIETLPEIKSKIKKKIKTSISLVLPEDSPKAVDSSVSGSAVPKPSEKIQSEPAKRIAPDALFDLAAVQFFPKGQVLIDAVYLNFFGNPEAGDGIYFLMIPCCFFLFYHLLQKWLGFGKYETLCLTAVLVLNPMLLYEELFSGMTGGNFALAFLLFVLAGWVWIQTGNRKWRPFVLGAFVYGCTLQFSALWFFAAVIAAYSLAWFEPRFLFGPASAPRSSRPALSAVKWFRTLAFGVGLLLFCGFHPFVTNTLRYSSPLYPCHSFCAKAHPTQNVMAPYFLNPEFKRTDRAQRFVFCFLDCFRPPRPWETHGPQHDARNIQFFSLFAPKPFGIFPLVLFGSLPLLLLVRTRASWLVLGGILVGLLLYPYVWSELFAPQIRAFPVLLMAIVLAEFRAAFSQKLPPDSLIGTQSASLSASESPSLSASPLASSFPSDSLPVSVSVSASDSVSDSASDSVSDSVSASDSVSNSASASDSNSNSVSNFTSVSAPAPVPFMLWRGTLLFRVVLGFLVWSSFLALGWACFQQYFLASQCWRAEKMMEINPQLSLGTVWEQLPPDANCVPDHYYVAPRPVTPSVFYFRSILTPRQLANLRFLNVPADLTLENRNLIYFRSLIFTFPLLEDQIQKEAQVQKKEPEPQTANPAEKPAAQSQSQSQSDGEKNVGMAFGQVPINQGSAYQQFVQRVRQLLRPSR